MYLIEFITSHSIEVSTKINSVPHPGMLSKQFWPLSVLLLSWCDLHLFNVLKPVYLIFYPMQSRLCAGAATHTPLLPENSHDWRVISQLLFEAFLPSKLTLPFLTSRADFKKAHTDKSLYNHTAFHDSLDAWDGSVFVGCSNCLALLT